MLKIAKKLLTIVLFLVISTSCQLKASAGMNLKQLKRALGETDDQAEKAKIKLLIQAREAAPQAAALDSVRQEEAEKARVAAERARVIAEAEKLAADEKLRLAQAEKLAQDAQLVEAAQQKAALELKEKATAAELNKKKKEAADAQSQLAAEALKVANLKAENTSLADNLAKGDMTSKALELATSEGGKSKALSRWNELSAKTLPIDPAEEIEFKELDYIHKVLPARWAELESIGGAKRTTEENTEYTDLAPIKDLLTTLAGPVQDLTLAIAKALSIYRIDEAKKKSAADSESNRLAEADALDKKTKKEELERQIAQLKLLQAKIKEELAGFAQKVYATCDPVEVLGVDAEIKKELLPNAFVPVKYPFKDFIAMVVDVNKRFRSFDFAAFNASLKVRKAPVRSEAEKADLKAKLAAVFDKKSGGSDKKAAAAEPEKKAEELELVVPFSSTFLSLKVSEDTTYPVPIFDEKSLRTNFTYNPGIRKLEKRERSDANRKKLDAFLIMVIERLRRAYVQHLQKALPLTFETAIKRKLSSSNDVLAPTEFFTAYAELSGKDLRQLYFIESDTELSTSPAGGRFASAEGAHTVFAVTRTEGETLAKSLLSESTGLNARLAAGINSLMSDFDSKPQAERKTFYDDALLLCDAEKQKLDDLLAKITTAKSTGTYVADLKSVLATTVRPTLRSEWVAIIRDLTNNPTSADLSTNNLQELDEFFSYLLLQTKPSEVKQAGTLQASLDASKDAISAAIAAFKKASKAMPSSIDETQTAAVFCYTRNIFLQHVLNPRITTPLLQYQQQSTVPGNSLGIMGLLTPGEHLEKLYKMKDRLTAVSAAAIKSAVTPKDSSSLIDEKAVDAASAGKISDWIVGQIANAYAEGAFFSKGREMANLFADAQSNAAAIKKYTASTHLFEAYANGAKSCAILTNKVAFEIATAYGQGATFGLGKNSINIDTDAPAAAVSAGYVIDTYLYQAFIAGAIKSAEIDSVAKKNSFAEGANDSIGESQATFKPKVDAYKLNTGDTDAINNYDLGGTECLKFVANAAKDFVDWYREGVVFIRDNGKSVDFEAKALEIYPSDQLVQYFYKEGAAEALAYVTTILAEADLVAQCSEAYANGTHYIGAKKDDARTTAAIDERHIQGSLSLAAFIEGAKKAETKSYTAGADFAQYLTKKSTELVAQLQGFYKPSTAFDKAKWMKDFCAKIVSGELNDLAAISRYVEEQEALQWNPLTQEMTDLFEQIITAAKNGLSAFKTAMESLAPGKDWVDTSNPDKGAGKVIDSLLKEERKASDSAMRAQREAYFKQQHSLAAVQHALTIIYSGIDADIKAKQIGGERDVILKLLQELPPFELDAIFNGADFQWLIASAVNKKMPTDDELAQFADAQEIKIALQLAYDFLKPLDNFKKQLGNKNKLEDVDFTVDSLKYAHFFTELKPLYQEGKIKEFFDAYVSVLLRANPVAFLHESDFDVLASATDFSVVSAADNKRFKDVVKKKAVEGGGGAAAVVVASGVEQPYEKYAKAFLTYYDGVGNYAKPLPFNEFAKMISTGLGKKGQAAQAAAIEAAREDFDSNSRDDAKGNALTKALLDNLAGGTDAVIKAMQSDNLSVDQAVLGRYADLMLKPLKKALNNRVGFDFSTAIVNLLKKIIDEKGDNVITYKKNGDVEKQDLIKYPELHAILGNPVGGGGMLGGIGAPDGKKASGGSSSGPAINNDDLPPELVLINRLMPSFKILFAELDKYKNYDREAFFQELLNKVVLDGQDAAKKAVLEALVQCTGGIMRHGLPTEKKWVELFTDQEVIDKFKAIAKKNQKTFAELKVAFSLFELIALELKDASFDPLIFKTTYWDKYFAAKCPVASSDTNDACFRAFIYPLFENKENLETARDVESECKVLFMRSWESILADSRGRNEKPNSAQLWSLVAVPEEIEATFDELAKAWMPLLSKAAAELDSDGSFDVQTFFDQQLIASGKSYSPASLSLFNDYIRELRIAKKGTKWSEVIEEKNVSAYFLKAYKKETTKAAVIELCPVQIQLPFSCSYSLAERILHATDEAKFKANSWPAYFSYKFPAASRTTVDACYAAFVEPLFADKVNLPTADDIADVCKVLFMKKSREILDDATTRAEGVTAEQLFALVLTQGELAKQQGTNTCTKASKLQDIANADVESADKYTAFIQQFKDYFESIQKEMRRTTFLKSSYQRNNAPVLKKVQEISRALTDHIIKKQLAAYAKLSAAPSSVADYPLIFQKKLAAGASVADALHGDQRAFESIKTVIEYFIGDLAQAKDASSTQSWVEKLTNEGSARKIDVATVPIVSEWLQALEDDLRYLKNIKKLSQLAHPVNPFEYKIDNAAVSAALTGAATALPGGGAAALVGGVTSLASSGGAATSSGSSSKGSTSSPKGKKTATTQTFPAAGGTPASTGLKTSIKDEQLDFVTNTSASDLLGFKDPVSGGSALYLHYLVAKMPTLDKDAYEVLSAAIAKEQKLLEQLDGEGRTWVNYLVSNPSILKDKESKKHLVKYAKMNPFMLVVPDNEGITAFDRILEGDKKDLGEVITDFVDALALKPTEMTAHLQTLATTVNDNCQKRQDRWKNHTLLQQFLAILTSPDNEVQLPEKTMRYSFSEAVIESKKSVIQSWGISDLAYVCQKLSLVSPTDQETADFDLRIEDGAISNKTPTAMTTKDYLRRLIVLYKDKKITELSPVGAKILAPLIKAGYIKKDAKTALDSTIFIPMYVEVIWQELFEGPERQAIVEKIAKLLPKDSGTWDSGPLSRFLKDSSQSGFLYDGSSLRPFNNSTDALTIILEVADRMPSSYEKLGDILNLLIDMGFVIAVDAMIKVATFINIRECYTVIPTIKEKYWRLEDGSGVPVWSMLRFNKLLEAPHDEAKKFLAPLITASFGGSVGGGLPAGYNKPAVGLLLIRRIWEAMGLIGGPGSI